MRFARSANGLGIRASEFTDGLVGESKTLDIAQQIRGQWKRRAREAAVHLHDRLDGAQKPAVDAGQLVNLFDADAVPDRLRNRENPQRSRVLQLIAQDVEPEYIRIEAAHADVEHAHGLLDDFR